MLRDGAFLAIVEFGAMAFLSRPRMRAATGRRARCFCASDAGEETAMSDAVEAAGQPVHEKAADVLGGPRAVIVGLIAQRDGGYHEHL